MAELLNASLMRWLLRVYPPYIGAGVRVTHIDAHWRWLDVEMPLRVYNRNYKGTHFGGSLYAMVDPHIMLLLIKRLGDDYVVWDSEACIKFIKPGRGKVHAHIEVGDADVADIKHKTQSGAKYFPTFEIAIRDTHGNMVAEVAKTLYVQRKTGQARSGNQKE